MRAKVHVVIILIAGVLEACNGGSDAEDAAAPSTGGAGGSAGAGDVAPPDLGPGAAATGGQGAAVDAAVVNAGQGGGGTSSLDAAMADATQDGGGTSSLDAAVANAGQGGGGTASLDAAQGEDTMPGREGGTDAEGGSIPPAAIDYGATGPFDDAKMFGETGPNGTSFLFRPDTSLGRDGFQHPVGVWGNGLGTSPDQYQDILILVASHGFVVIGCPDPIAEEPCLTSNLDWLVQQNDGSGPLAGKLDISSEFSMGYSWGGGAAIDVSTRPNMKASISVHGMFARSNAWGSMHGSLLLLSSTGDTLVAADGPVASNYNNSQVPTFFGVIQDEEVRHMYGLDADSFSCTGGAPDALGLGPCMGAIEEQAPIVAWLSYWIYGDQGARSYLFGDDCKLCSGRWTAQRKNWN